jgi:hypothetical protein
MTDPGTPPRNAAPEVPESLPTEWEGAWRLISEYLQRYAVNPPQNAKEFAEQARLKHQSRMLTALADAERRAARAEAQLDAARNKGLELASAVADARAAINREAP